MCRSDVLRGFLCVQVFDNTAAALDGTLAAGDEITGVNGKPVKGKTKVEVAKMIQAVQVQHLKQQLRSSQVSNVIVSDVVTLSSSELDDWTVFMLTPITQHTDFT